MQYSDVILLVCLSCVTVAYSQTTVAFEKCVDKVDCSVYGEGVCEGSYKPWATDNCAQYCGFCVGPTTPAPPCEDTAKVDCAMYGDDMCTSKTYERWAKVHCRRHCGHCTYTGPTTTTTQPTTTAVPFSECVDKVNCGSYGDYVCTSDDFKPWARTNCRNFCNFCVGPTTPAPPCEDVAKDCNSHDVSICTADSYKDWAASNCRRWCGFCTYTGPTTAPPTTPPTTTLAPEKCVDKISNCKSFGDYGCRGDYEPWARNNCPKTCGFCIGIPEPPLPCVDVQSNCNAYDKSICTSSSYKDWAGANCRKYCDLCNDGVSNVTTPATTISVPSTTTSDGECEYKGSTYKHGETWTDGCSLVCKCLDGSKKYHMCKDRCPKWNLGDGCRYVTVPGQCCPTVRCGQLDDGSLVG